MASGLAVDRPWRFATVNGTQIDATECGTPAVKEVSKTCRNPPQITDAHEDFDHYVVTFPDGSGSDYDAMARDRKTRMGIQD
jgi:hypothetical protein